MENLFSANRKNIAPLAEKMRPRSLDDFAGQESIVGKGTALRNLIIMDNLSSIILWGPPGTGKTSLGAVIASSTKSNFIEFSAVMNGVADLRKIVKYAENELELRSKKTIVFVDEIHRLNKAQQDAFLPHTERGTFILIGATTENPSFTINNALLSRSQVFVLKSLDKKDLQKILLKAVKFLNTNLDQDASELLIRYAMGDARRLLSSLEFSFKLANGQKITSDVIKRTIKEKSLLYDRKGEEHYNVISAFIKSMRGSDIDAAVYYLARMLEAGEDPRFIARRLVIFASEDIGLADNLALTLAMSTFQASEKLGMPEIRIPLAHTVCYLSKAKKNNFAYKSIDLALQEVKRSGALAVPLHLRNAPTNLMKELNYSKGYEYAHDIKDKKPSHHHLPEEIKNKVFYKVS